MRGKVGKAALGERFVGVEGGGRGGRTGKGRGGGKKKQKREVSVSLASAGCVVDCMLIGVQQRTLNRRFFDDSEADVMYQWPDRVCSNQSRYVRAGM